ncbi:hypothetical protein RR48_02963 [Papilio machaon]|uniref:Uncharacterized protein n=1 Tax=Papilio machaon TaxID=76193 RepID=A0A0N1ICS1_PAPMA|nr:hypothetical protein RR48_02963 [Papilio machaon]
MLKPFIYPLYVHLLKSRTVGHGRGAPASGERSCRRNYTLYMNTLRQHAAAVTYWHTPPGLYYTSYWSTPQGTHEGAGEALRRRPTARRATGDGGRLSCRSARSHAMAAARPFALPLVALLIALIAVLLAPAAAAPRARRQLADDAALQPLDRSDGEHFSVTSRVSMMCARSWATPCRGGRLRHRPPRALGNPPLPSARPSPAIPLSLKEDAAEDEQTREKRKLEGVTQAKFGIKNAVLGFVFGKINSLIDAKTRFVDTLDRQNIELNKQYGIEPPAPGGLASLSGVVTQVIGPKLQLLGPKLQAVTGLLGGLSGGSSAQGGGSGGSGLGSILSLVTSLSGSSSGGGGGAAPSVETVDSSEEES